MRLPAEHIRDVPIFWPTAAGHGSATLHVLCVGTTPAAIDVGADGRAADRTEGRSDIVPATAADLVTEHAPEHAADDRPRHVRAVVADHLLALDPAALLGRADDRTDGDDVRLVQALAVLRVVRVRLRRGRRRRDVLRLAARPADRRHAIVETHRAEVRILAGLQHHAAAAEVRVLAHFPAPALHDGRRRAIVVFGAVEVGNGAVDRI